MENANYQQTPELVFKPVFQDYRYCPFLKVHVILLHFYEIRTLVPVFTNQKKYKEDFHLVIASFTLSLSAYERFYRNALHSISGGNVFIL